MKFAAIVYIIIIKFYTEGISDILNIIEFIMKNMAKNCIFLLSEESKILNIDNFLNKYLRPNKRGMGTLLS